MGFGASSRLHTTKILRLSEDLPLVIEIVDSEDKINGFLPTLDGMMTSGLITLEKVQVLQYGTKGSDGLIRLGTIRACHCLYSGRITCRPRGWSPPKPPFRLMTPATRLREQEDIMCSQCPPALGGSSFSATNTR